MINIEWAEDAIKDLEKLDRAVAQRVLNKINWLASNFERIIPEPLTGELKGTFKLRSSDKRRIVVPIHPGKDINPDSL